MLAQFPDERCVDIEQEEDFPNNVFQSSTAESTHIKRIGKFNIKCIICMIYCPKYNNISEFPLGIISEFP